MRHRRPGRTRSLGIALILVLWVLTLLTVMAVGMTAAQRTETALADNRIGQARFRALADAAIAYAMYRLMQAGPSAGPGLGSGAADDGEGGEQTDWIPNGAPRPWQFDGMALTVAVYNESSRVNLNLAQAPVLAALMVALGVEDKQAGALADAILDFRDEDDLKLLNGAEDADYASAGLPIGAKDAPFAAVEELQQVLGMTPELYRLLAPELTVDTDSERIEPAFATPAVLAAIDGISLEEAEQRVQERDRPALPDGQGSGPADRGGPRYRIEVRTVGAEGHSRSMEALAELTPGQPIPYRVHWRRYARSAPAAPPADGESERPARP